MRVTVILSINPLVRFVPRYVSRWDWYCLGCVVRVLRSKKPPEDLLLLSALCPHAAITFCMRYFGSYSGLQSSSSQPCALTVLPILPFWFAFVPEVNLGGVCDRSKDKPVVNP